MCLIKITSFSCYKNIVFFKYICFFILLLSTDILCRHNSKSCLLNPSSICILNEIKVDTRTSQLIFKYLFLICLNIMKYRIYYFTIFFLQIPSFIENQVKSQSRVEWYLVILLQYTGVNHVTAILFWSLEGRGTAAVVR